VTADARLIRTERYEDIGRIIRRDAGLLIDRWAHRAVQEQPTASRVHHQVLLDHLPRFLDELGVHLATPGDNGSPHHPPAARHGEQRWEAGWSLPEVIRDYRILRLVILEHLDGTLDRPLTLMEIQAVGLALDEAIEASVDRYVQSRDEQLRKMEEGLKEADRRKNEFLATLAHELRNPLMPLRNCLDLVRLSGDAPTTFRHVREMMERQTRQMTRLVEDLLDVSRIAQGKLVLHKERFDLRLAVEQAVQMNAPLQQERRHQFSVTVPAEPLWVQGDQARVVQIVVNLLNNAAKYTSPGGQVALTAAREGDQAVVRVKDTGLGIAPEKLAQIFDLFTQLDLGPERLDGGLGIGLTLVKRLVEMHGGSIMAMSPGPGQGSEFVVRLPAVAAPEQPAASAPPNLTKSRPANSRHILIVEDNADGRESLATLLRLLGHRVDVAEDGPGGVAAALALRPEVALIDIGLPKLDGYEVARQVRASLGPAVLLVALTGYGQPEDQQRALAAGCNAHLVKPVELQALQTLLADP
jgi:signal transduction histidine kinase/CheY-like chemotaxis protein